MLSVYLVPLLIIKFRVMVWIIIENLQKCRISTSKNQNFVLPPQYLNKTKYTFAIRTAAFVNFKLSINYQ